MADITVRAEKPSDIQAIEVINISAFEGEAEAQLVTDIRNSPAYVPELSMVAEYKGRLVGYIMLSTTTLKGNGTSLDILILAPMSVVPSQCHRGIGGALLHSAIQKSRELGFKVVVEVGQPDYYRRHGFKPLANYPIQHNVDVNDELITLLELEDGALSQGGTIVFPPMFKGVYSRAA